MRAAVLLLALVVPAHAVENDENSVLRQFIHGHTTCADVRQVVAIVGADEIERRARAGGAPESRIQWAKRCLKR
jgi:hypothetical protein